MKQRSGFTVMFRLIGLVRPLAGYMLTAVGLGVAGFVCSTFLTVLGAWSLWNLLAENGQSVGLFLGLIALFGVLRGFLRYGEQACNHYIAFKLLALIRDKIFTALRRLCPAKLEGRDKGDLISVITSDIELLEVFYAHTISPVLIALLMCGGMSIWLGSFHPLLGLTAAVSYVLVGVVLPLTAAKRGGDTALRFRNQNGELSAFMLDSLRGLSQTLQYHDGQSRLNALKEQSDALTAQEAKMKRQTAFVSACANTLILVCSLGMLFLAAELYRQGSVGPQAVLLSFTALISSFGPVVALANLGTTLQNTLAAGNRVLDLLEETPQVEENPHGAEITFDGAECRSVSFSYDGQPVLNDVSVKLRPGEILGICGRSGSGKSTLLKLLMRFWDVREGSISVSGVPIADIQTASLRKAEGYVTQDTHLFRDTIENNLKVANPHATREQIIAACKKASIHELIESLPQGYETNVGELGDSLSGGERQRIGIARAFLHNAPLVLLDEPTSNLDSLNESIILHSLYAERGKKTFVLVSHRASTMRIADEQIWIEQGKVLA